MSTAISKAVRARLAGTDDITGYPKAIAARAQLLALLAVDRDGKAIATAPVVRFGNKGESVVYPEITYRFSPGTNMGISADGEKFENSVYDFEVWEQSKSGSVCSDILDCMERLLDMQRGAPPLTLETGLCYWCEVFVPAGMIYDANLNAWCGLVRYRFVEARD